MLSDALQVSRVPASHLRSQIQAIINEDASKIFSRFDKVQIVGALESFRAAFTSELAVSDAYFVIPKGGFDTLKLVSAGESLFPPDLAKKVPTAIPDVREAGKCLAFELPTAAAFHIFRAIESYVTAYWDNISSGAERPEHKNLGVYLRELDRIPGADPLVLAAMKQLKDLHRNPLIHPEMAIDLTEAIAIVGMAHGVMAALLRHLPALEQSLAVQSDEQVFQP